MQTHTITFRTLTTDEPFIPDALDEQRIPRCRAMHDRTGRPLVVWWQADEQGNVTDIYEDTRGTLRNILSK